MNVIEHLPTIAVKNDNYLKIKGHDTDPSTTPILRFTVAAKESLDLLSSSSCFVNRDICDCKSVI